MQAPVIISIIPNELDKLATITPRTRPLNNLFIYYAVLEAAR